VAYSEQLERRTYLAGPSVVKWVGVPGMPGSIEPNVGTQYLLVKLDTANKDVVELATGAAGEVVVGVTTTKSQHPKMPVAVAFSGRVPVQAGAALAYGDYVKPGPGGQAVVGTKADGIGMVVEAASAKGVLATIELSLGR
jgi:hypothetical protein